MKTSILAISLSFLAACSSAPEPENPYLACGSAGPDTDYFPVGTFAPYIPPPRPGYAYRLSDRDPDPEARELLLLTMDYLELPSLTCGAPPADETHRLVWDRSFDPLVAIQIDRTGGRYTLDVSMPREGRLSGKPLDRIYLQLTKAEWSRITAGLQKIDFWNLYVSGEEAGNFVKEGTGEIVVTSRKDGASWVIEGRKGSLSYREPLEQRR
jgi:hypothetical protein